MVAAAAAAAEEMGEAVAEVAAGEVEEVGDAAVAPAEEAAAKMM